MPPCKCSLRKVVVWPFDSLHLAVEYFNIPLFCKRLHIPPVENRQSRANFGAVGAFDDTLSQVLPTVAGATYTLTFWLSHDSTNAANDFNVYWNGVPIFSLVNAPEFNWTEETFVLVATSSSTTLSFAGRENPAWYGLDDVSVTPGGVPEPASLFLLGSSLLGIGGLARKRTKQV